jgi:hypothetical protein
MERLEDTYYTDQILDGVPSATGIKQLSPSFTQGEDIRICFYLNYKDAPVDPSKHKISIFVKKSPAANTVLWLGQLWSGVYPVDRTPGFFSMIISNEVSSQIIPGLYYASIMLQEKIGEGDRIKDYYLQLKEFTFNVELSASSPNPKDRPNQVQDVSIDLETGIFTITKKSSEPTLPLPTTTT